MSDIAEIDEQPISTADESEPKNSDSKSLNHHGGIAAIARCIVAKRHALGEAVADGQSDDRAKRAGDMAYLRAMPALSDLDSIREFIACVTYALATEVIGPKESLPLLEAAKVSLVALREYTRPSSVRAA